MCRAESPHLSKIQKQFRSKDVVVLAINADNDGRGRIREFVAENDLQQRMLLRGDGVGFQQYHLKAMPSVYFIDRSGKVVDREVGFRNQSQIEKTLEKVLGRE